MSAVGLVFDDVFRRHDTGPGHPERVARLEAIGEGLATSGLVDRLVRVAPTPSTDADLELVHDADYIRRVAVACADGAPYIDTPDSAICRQSEHVARLAAGAVVSAADRIAAGELRRAFCAVRPPGHHAERSVSMGFCLFNNIAVAARVLQRRHGFERILILDWDVHHGNGTQHTFEEDPGVLFVSLHADPRTLYPGTGFAHERGRGAGSGYTLNVPLEPGSDDDECRRVFEDPIIPAIIEYEPQVVLLSAGFDAHGSDPVGNLGFSDAAFDWMGTRLIELADRFAEGRILSVLEGGYDLGVLQRVVPAHLSKLVGQ